jgi:plasmid stabilization system protein ParE
MAIYKLSKKAQSDIDDITGYTALHFGERQAVTYTDSIHAAAQITANFPSLGRPYTTKKASSTSNTILVVTLCSIDRPRRGFSWSGCCI